MAQFLLMIYVDPSDPRQHPDPASAEYAKLLQAYYDLDAAAKDAGVLIESGALQLPDASTMVRVRDGEIRATSEAFTEPDRRLEGFYLIDCPTLDEAVTWAAKIPHAAMHAVEIRPLVAFPSDPAST